MTEKSTGAVTAEIYIFRNKKVRVGKAFIYEVTLYKQTKNCYSLLSSKLYKSEELLTYTHRTKAPYKDGIIIKFIDLLEAPLDFLKLNGSLFVPNENTGKRRRKQSSLNAK